MTIRRSEDLTGRVFADGMIRVLRRAPKRKGDRHARWYCQCACGRRFTEYGYRLKSGARKSCGCLDRARIRKEQMRRPTVSLYRIKRSEGNPYRNLADAIIAVAADDYRGALKDHNQDLARSLEEFFNSPWYRELTDVDACFLISALRRDSVDSLAVVFI